MHLPFFTRIATVGLTLSAAVALAAPVSIRGRDAPEAGLTLRSGDIATHALAIDVTADHVNVLEARRRRRKGRKGGRRRRSRKSRKGRKGRKLKAAAEPAAGVTPEPGVPAPEAAKTPDKQAAADEKENLSGLNDETKQEEAVDEEVGEDAAGENAAAEDAAGEDAAGEDVE